MILKSKICPKLHLMLWTYQAGLFIEYVFCFKLQGTVSTPILLVWSDDEGSDPNSLSWWLSSEQVRHLFVQHGLQNHAEVVRNIVNRRNPAKDCPVCQVM